MINQPDNKLKAGYLFLSRRNQVELIYEKGKLCVRKIYADPGFAATEKRNYEFLIKSNVNVLLPIKMDEKSLVLPYVSGMTGLELLEWQERNNSFRKKEWDDLAKWCCMFYKKSGLVLGEPHLRNFILENGSGVWYGIDFEESRAGEPVCDFGTLMAYILNYYPKKTLIKKKAVKAMSRIFLKEMAVKRHILLIAQKKAAKELASRRKQML